MQPICPLLVRANLANALKFGRYLSRLYKYTGDIREIDSETTIGVYEGIGRFDESRNNGQFLTSTILYGVKKRVWVFVRRSQNLAYVPYADLKTTFVYADPIFSPGEDSTESHGNHNAYNGDYVLFRNRLYVDFVDVTADNDLDKIFSLAAETLPRRSFDIFCAYYLDHKTLTQIGTDFASTHPHPSGTQRTLTRERIRQILAKSIEAIKNAMR